MLRLATVLATLAFTHTAAAQNCPPGASTAATVPNGASVRIIGLSTEDAYYSDSYAKVIGTNGITTAQLTNNGGCWYGGPVTASDGESYYFFKAALVVTSQATPQAATARCPASAITTIPTAGSTYSVLALHPDDAYTSGGVSVGTTVSFHSGASVTDGCWIGGAARGADGSDLYFYKVAVGQSTNARVLQSCPRNATTSPVAAGSQVRLLGIHSEDAYANGAGNFSVGDVFTTTAALNQNDGCWYGGSMTTQGGESLYFYMAAFEPVSGKGKGGGLVASIDALPTTDDLDQRVSTLLTAQFDRNSSGNLDTLNEVNGLPCDVLNAIDRRYQSKWSSSVRTVLGFKSDFIWVGNAIGFHESMRNVADRRFERCGIQ